MVKSQENEPVPVFIVGAGPTGLVLAIWLRKKGIKVRIIDKSSEPGTTSRALAVQARTLEFYQQLGIAEKLIKAGISASEITMRRSGKAIAQARFGALGKGMSPFPYLLFCPQDIHETLLCEELKKLGTEVERNTEIIEFTQDQELVSIKIKNGESFEDVKAEYICGCDGAHSLVRHQLPTEFKGGTYHQVFFVADVLATGEAAAGGVQISLSKKDFCIIMPVKSKGSIRLTGLVPKDSEKKENVSFSDVKDSVTKNSGLLIQRVNWFSSYHVHHRVAEKFQNKRAFLAGDAGHIHSPAGGQGMNTGIGDAINLAWKLADVVSGKFSDKLLLSYEVERKAFAKTLIKTTDTAFKLIASRSFVGATFRAYILPNLFQFLTTLKPFLNFAFRTISQIRIKYPQSPISEGKCGGVHAGDRLPWIRQGRSDNFVGLESLDWQIHIYGTVNERFRHQCQEILIPLHQYEWNEEARDKGIYPDGVYLIRPDGYIAFASKVQEADEIKSYIGRKLL